MNKKLKIGLLTASLLITTNSFAVGMTSAEYTAAKTLTDTKQWLVEKAEAASQWGVESGFHETLTELSLENQVLSTQAGFNGNKVYDTVMNKAGDLGGPYSEELSGIMDSCFGLDLPDFSKSLGLNGISFCGIGDLSSIVGKEVKKRTASIQSEGDNELTEAPKKPATVVMGKTDSSKTNCNEQIDKNCSTKQKEDRADELKHGVNKNGGTSTNALKVASEEVFNKMNPDNPEDDDAICVHNELNNGSTEAYACKKDIVSDMEKQRLLKVEAANNTSKLIDASEREVRKNVLKTNETFAESITDRVNTSREIRDDYNIKYNPNKVVYQDVEKFGERSFYKMNKEFLTQDPTLYIVPMVKDNKFAIGKYGLDNYEKAEKEFTKMKIEDVDGNVLEDSTQIKQTINRLGGVTPFTSALYGYDASLSIMAKNVYDGTAEKAGEQGAIGREMAVISGLKGVMYQSMMINQQLENMNRANYNIRLKEFDKISSDNDNLNNKLEQIQNQNALVIDLLKDISTSLKKMANQ